MKFIEIIGKELLRAGIIEALPELTTKVDEASRRTSKITRTIVRLLIALMLTTLLAVMAAMFCGVYWSIYFTNAIPGSTTVQSPYITISQLGIVSAGAASFLLLLVLLLGFALRRNFIKLQMEVITTVSSLIPSPKGPEERQPEEESPRGFSSEILATSPISAFIISFFLGITIERAFPKLIARAAFVMPFLGETLLSKVQLKIREIALRSFNDFISETS